jgi:hypothetical protein
MIIELNSVACVFDTTTKTIYAKYQMGGYDKTSGVQLDKLTEHFVSQMSMDDIVKINESIPTFNYDGTPYNDLLKYRCVRSKF